MGQEIPALALSGVINRPLQEAKRVIAVENTNRHTKAIKQIKGNRKKQSRHPRHFPPHGFPA
jgi:hypothetical protein